MILRRSQLVSMKRGFLKNGLGLIEIRKFADVASVIEKGDSDELRRIFKTGQFYDINEPKPLDHNGPTLLIVACKSGFVDCVKVLLEYEAYLNSHHSSNRSTLSYACDSGSVEMVRFIITSGFRICDEAIMDIFKSANLSVQNTEIISLLITYIKNIDYIAHSDVSFLYQAASSGTIDIVQSLLKRGATLRQSCLIVASNNGHLEVVKLLIAWGTAHKLLSLENYVNLLIQASSYGSINTVRYMLETWILGASAITAALSAAVKAHRAQVAEYLIDKGVQYKIPTMKDAGLLTFACRELNIDMVRLLVARGADPNSVDSTGNLPLYIVLYHPNIVEILLEAGADPNVYCNSGSAPLFDTISCRLLMYTCYSYVTERTRTSLMPRQATPH